MLEKMLLRDAQNDINEVYGENEWEVLKYNGSHSPCTLKHKCGLEKQVSRFSTFKLGKTKCKCQHSGVGGKWTFEDLAKKIDEITYGTYELIDLKDSREFTVNHKSCDRKPFKTSSARFFTRNQRCACSKCGRSGRKSNKENIAELNRAIKENENNAN